MEKSLIVVPARSGSKGIPKKNTKLLNGKPLISYTLEIGKQIPNSSLCVTTNDEEVKEIAKNYTDIIINRSSNLSSDTTPMEEVLLDTIQRVGKSSKEKYDNLILLQPTSPLRRVNDVTEALNLYKQNVQDLILSVTLAKENPYYTQLEEINGDYINVKNHVYKTRQECPNVYNINGSIYIFNIQKFLEIQNLKKFRKRIFLMETQFSIDIDEPFDFKLAELLMINHE